MDWKKTVCDFVIFRGAAVVQLLGTSIEKPRQARAIPKNHDRRVRFRKTMAGTCDSETTARTCAPNKNTAGACDSEKTPQARQGAPGIPMVGRMPHNISFSTN